MLHYIITLHVLYIVRLDSGFVIRDSGYTLAGLQVYGLQLYAGYESVVNCKL